MNATKDMFGRTPAEVARDAAISAFFLIFFAVAVLAQPASQPHPIPTGPLPSITHGLGCATYFHYEGRCGI